MEPPLVVGPRAQHGARWTAGRGGPPVRRRQLHGEHGRGKQGALPPPEWRAADAVRPDALRRRCKRSVRHPPAPHAALGVQPGQGPPRHRAVRLLCHFASNSTAGPSAGRFCGRGHGYDEGAGACRICPADRYSVPLQDPRQADRALVPRPLDYQSVFAATVAAAKKVSARAPQWGRWRRRTRKEAPQTPFVGGQTHVWKFGNRGQLLSSAHKMVLMVLMS